MARQIDPDNLTPHDISYLEQRPWLIKELEIETSRSFDEVKAEVLGEETGDANASLSESAELSALRRQVARLEEQLSEKDTDLAVAKQQAADLQQTIDEMDEEDDDEEVPPYDEWEHPDLQAEVKRRREQDGEDIKPASQSTKDLIAALEASDNARESSDE